MKTGKRTITKLSINGTEYIVRAKQDDGSYKYGVHCLMPISKESALEMQDKEGYLIVDNFPVFKS